MPPPHFRKEKPMNYKSYPVGVHINENSVKTLDGIVQNDNGNLFQVQLYSGTDAYDFTGYTVINATIVRPDKTKISDVWPMGQEEVDPDGEITDGSHTFLAIQYLDAKNGRISLRVGGWATAQAGLHRMAIEIYTADARVTTARINYHVVESLNNIDQTILDADEDYVALKSLLAECSDILDEEQERVNQEAARAANENARSSRFSSLDTQMQEEIDYARVLFNEAVAQGQMNNLTAHLENYINDRAGIVPYTSDVAAWFDMHQGIGMTVYSTEDQLMYIGTGEGDYLPIITYKPYVAGLNPPADTRSLWIDTNSGNTVKYYNGSSWVSTGAVALFG